MAQAMVKSFTLWQVNRLRPGRAHLCFILYLPCACAHVHASVCTSVFVCAGWGQAELICL